MSEIDQKLVTDKKVLVTGASGFIGSHCLPHLLDAGYEVHAVSSRHITQLPPPGIVWYQANLLSPNKIQALIEAVQPTHLLHLAWYTAHGKYWTAAENLDWVEASVHLAKAFVAQGGRRTLMTGTCAEYDWENGVCNEEKTPLNPKTPYGVAKKSLFEMLDCYQHILGSSAIWARLFFVYGPGEPSTRLLPHVIRCMLENQKAQCTHGQQQRDFLYVDDAAKALVQLLDSNMEGAVNVGSGVATPVKSLIQIAADRLEKPHLIQYGTIPLSPDEPPILIADTKRLSETGFIPQWTHEDGVESTLQYWQNKQKNLQEVHR